MKKNIALTSELTWELRLRIIIGAMFLAAMFLLYDLASDFYYWGSEFHLLLECTAILFLAAILTYLLRLLFLLRRDMQGLTSRLKSAEADADEWRAAAQGLAKGVSQIIEQQFVAWGFTPAEKEVGILLLKGLSFKEIASLRQTSERTVRQQAQELYRKSSLSGRAAFSAYFMEDLLVFS